MSHTHIYKHICKTKCMSCRHCAVCCSVLTQCVDNTLQHTATHCKTLQHTATHCNSMSCRHCCQGSVQCVVNTLQHTATATHRVWCAKTIARVSLTEPYFGRALLQKETSNVREPTNRSHLICACRIYASVLQCVAE